MIITKVWDGYQIEADDIGIVFLNTLDPKNPSLAIMAGALSIPEAQKLIEAQQVAIRIASGDTDGLVIKESTS